MAFTRNKEYSIIKVPRIKGKSIIKSIIKFTSIIKVPRNKQIIKSIIKFK